MSCRLCFSPEGHTPDCPVGIAHQMAEGIRRDVLIVGDSLPIKAGSAALAATLQAAGYRILFVDSGVSFDTLSAGFKIESGHGRLSALECLTLDSCGWLNSRPLIMDEIMESGFFDFPIRPVEPWQGKPTIHQEKPQQPVSDNLLKLLARAHK